MTRAPTDLDEKEITQQTATLVTLTFCRAASNPRHVTKCTKV